jgi:NADPH-dependent F420 reductase
VVTPRTIAILGGGGALGAGLAKRFAHAGHTVVIGSRDPAKTLSDGADLAPGVTVATHVAAATQADIAFLTVPFAGQAHVLGLVAEALTGKILVDSTVPLVPPKVGRVQLPTEGSAGQIAQHLVGDRVRVVSALQNVGAAHLAHVDAPIACDVLVCGDQVEARAEVIALIADIGLRGLHAGPLANAAAAEALTSVLISINRFYKSDRAGLLITGI